MPRKVPAVPAPVAPPAQAVVSVKPLPAGQDGMSGRMTTRAKNKDAHPGMPDVSGWDADHPERIPLPPAQKREQNAAARAQEAATTAQKAAKRSAAVLKAAQIENRKQEEDRIADEARRHPTRPKPRPRPHKLPEPSSVQSNGE